MLKATEKIVASKCVIPHRRIMMVRVLFNYSPAKLISCNTLFFFTLDDVATSFFTKTGLCSLFFVPGYCRNLFCQTFFSAALFWWVVINAFFTGKQVAAEKRF